MYTENEMSFGGEAIYEIQVVGSLNKIPSDIADDKQIETIQLSDNKYKHSIKCFIRDQAELSGLLNTIYDIHLTVLSVNYLNEDYRKIKT